MAETEEDSRPPSAGWRIVAALALAAGLCVCETLEAAEPNNGWATGAAFRQQLASPVGVFWSGQSLRKALTGVCTSRRVAVLLDRRVDPDQKLDLRADDLPLEDLLAKVADERQLGMTRLGSVVYLGPPEVASRLRTLSQLRQDDLRGLPAGVARKLTEVGRLRWDDFATPREVLGRLSEESGVEIRGVEQLPHDLWAGVDLPPLSAIDRLTLITIQFDLTFEVSAAGSAVRLVPVPEVVAIDRQYAVAGRDPRQMADEWSRMLPDARVKAVGGKVLVRGTVEDHEQIAALLHGGTRPEAKEAVRRPVRRPGASADPLSAERFTLKEIRGPVGGMARKLAGQIGVELRFDQQAIEQAGISLNETVAVSVEKATVDQLFRAVLSPAGLDFRRQGKVIEVFPAAR